MSKLKVLDLFSGIGGFSLGLERTNGFETVAFCEIDPYCRGILRWHWPDVYCFDDIREIIGPFRGINAICGGFPCQDASIGQTKWGKRIGIDGERTGLWREIKRLAADIRPEVVVLENVPGLLTAGFGTVLGDLAEIGFDAEWRCIPASSAGLPHRRDRLCIVSYPCGSRLSRPVGGKSILESAEASLAELGNEAARAWRSLDDALDGLRGRNGFPVGMERRRIKPLGNAIVPVLAEAIGRAIMRAYAEQLFGTDSPDSNVGGRQDG
jgi:DNA (cytosine-5)-methyltransferase 1